jgi:exopolysaccharide biosynthesis predicted pyruvyltransferase EpsI
MPGTPNGIALVGVSMGSNLGDSALWAAADRMIQAFNPPAKYVCSFFGEGSFFPGEDKEIVTIPKCNETEMRQVVGPSALVLLQPGGNWGDLWRHEHTARNDFLLQLAEVVRKGDASYKVSSSSSSKVERLLLHITPCSSSKLDCQWQ